MSAWSCLVDAYAELVGVTSEQVFEELGHDGSRIIYDDLPDPHCREGFHIQEIQALAEKNDWFFSRFDFHPKGHRLVGGRIREYRHRWSPDLVKELMEKMEGILIYIRPTGVRHAVAWKPSKPVILEQDVQLESFYALVKCI